MVEWTPKTEQLIRDVSDFVDKQFRTVLDPEIGVTSTIARLFNAKSTGEHLFKRAINELEIDLSADPEHSLKKVIDLAEANGSDAADKLKRAAPVAKQLAEEFGFGPDTKMGKLQQLSTLNKIKKKGIKY